VSAHREDERFTCLRNGLQLCYRTDGPTAGDPIVLIAGLGQQLTVWPRAFVDALVAHGYFVVRVDNRDAGRSTMVNRPAPGTLRLLLERPRRDAYTLDAMACDVVDLLDALAVGRAHLVGQSMGGMIAQNVAAQAPQRVASLTSIYSTTGHRKVGGATLATKLLLSGRAARSSDEFVAAHMRMTRHLAGRDYAVNHEHETAYAAEAWARAGGANPGGLARQIQAIHASGDRTRRLHRITAPTLVVHGDRDPIVDPSGGSATAHAIPGARLVTIPGMGHHLAPGLVPRFVDLITHTAEGAHA
jgi:pimeloyl-ACP methyl ester carboxylesterase